MSSFNTNWSVPEIFLKRKSQFLNQLWSDSGKPYTNPQLSYGALQPARPKSNYLRYDYHKFFLKKSHKLNLVTVQVTKNLPSSKWSEKLNPNYQNKSRKTKNDYPKPTLYQEDTLINYNPDCCLHSLDLTLVFSFPNSRI